MCCKNLVAMKNSFSYNGDIMDTNKKKLKNKIHTFVVCAYKDSPYLEDCIKSLKAQTIESNIIMITSTPSEYISGIANKYDIKLSVNLGNSGIAQDWNFGVVSCDSRYITIAHQDDIYDECYLEAILEKLQKTKDALIAFTDYGEIRMGEKVTKSQMLTIKRLLLSPLRIKKLQNKNFFKKLILRFGNPICCPSVTYCMDKLSLPIFEVGYGSNLDWQTWVDLSERRGSFAYVNEPLMYHRIHSDSTTSGLIENSGRGKEDLDMFEKLWPKPVAKFIEKFYKKSEKLND